MKEVLGEYFYSFEIQKSTKRKLMFINSLRVGQGVSKAKGEPTREWIGGAPTLWLLLN
jgi:hypothetical protein